MVAGKKLTCHVAKKSPHICPDHMAKDEISSTIVFKCTDEAVICVGSLYSSAWTWSDILRIRFVKIAAVRCVEMGEFGGFLWATVFSRRKKLPALSFLCSGAKPHEGCTMKSVPKTN